MGYGAIYELARILDAFRQQLREPNLTYSVGLVLGGSSAEVNAQETGGTADGKPNVIPATAIAIGDIRALTPEQEKSVEEKMQQIVAQHLPKTDAKIRFYEGYPPMAPTAGNRALLKQMNDVNRDLGLPEEPELDPMRRGAGDISFVAEYVAGLAGVGAVGSGSHAPGETMDLSAMPRLTKRVAVLMERLAGE
jgi:glutamate carboxypeptidase